MRSASLEALILEHPAGKTASLLRDQATKLKGPAGRSAREQAIQLEQKAAGRLVRRLRVYLEFSGFE